MFLAVISGSWLLTSAREYPQQEQQSPENEQPDLRLHPGDLILIGTSGQQRLHAESDTNTQALPKVLCIKYFTGDNETPSESGLPQLLHLRSAFSPAGCDTSPENLLKFVSRLLVSVLLSTTSTGGSSNRAPGIDPEVAAAITAMENSPAAAWTVQRLALEAGISRSALAQKFKDQTGQTPNDYLLNIRMRLAEELMREHRQHLKEIARRTGYQSVSAFSTAFKRWSGASPSAHRKRPLS